MWATRLDIVEEIFVQSLVMFGATNQCFHAERLLENLN